MYYSSFVGGIVTVMVMLVMVLLLELACVCCCCRKGLVYFSQCVFELCVCVCVCVCVPNIVRVIGCRGCKRETCFT